MKRTRKRQTPQIWYDLTSYIYCMQIKIFDILARCQDEDIDLLNKFLRANRVLDVDRQFYVTSDQVGHWSIAVTYLPSHNSIVVGERREKIDYKEVLSVDDFDRFTKLRSIRKQLANSDAVPAYAVFTDAELAQIAQLSNIDTTSIAKISGIGERRIEKYGRALCEMLAEGV